MKPDFLLSDGGKLSEHAEKIRLNSAWPIKPEGYFKRLRPFNEIGQPGGSLQAGRRVFFLDRSQIGHKKLKGERLNRNPLIFW